MKYYLGLDIGDRRIGLALADTDAQVAKPFSTLPNNRSFINELVKLHHRYHFVAVIVGLPYTFAGVIGKQATKVTELVEKLNKKIDVPIHFEDERLTTKMAQAKIQQEGSFQDTIDAVSAQVILTNWLAKNQRQG